MSDPTYSPPPPPPPYGAPPPPPSYGGGGGGTVSENRQVFLVLSYIWLLALIPFLLEKNDREVQWHAKHGLVLCAVEIVLGIIVSIVSAVVVFIGCVIGPLFSIAILVLHVMCIVKALNGQRLIIPGISQYADQF